MSYTRLRPLRAAAALALVLLCFGGSASAQPPTISLGPIQVTAGGVATVTGTVTSAGTKSTNGSVQVSLNGQPFGVDQSGSFQASINLGGGGGSIAESLIQVGASNPATGERFTIAIPARLAGPGGGVIANALAELRSAGIEVTQPPSGFQSVDGGPVPFELVVAEPQRLSVLTVNGQPARDRNGRPVAGAGAQRPAGGSGPVTVVAQPVPSAAGTITVHAQDTRGVRQTTTFPVLRLTSTIRTRAGVSITAAGARGLRITSIKYDTRRSPVTRKLGMTVTLRDLRGYLVRDAAVTITGVKQATTTISGRQSRISDRYGRATFLVPLRPAVFAKRLAVAVSARTPSAQAKRISSVMLPRLRQAA